MRVLLGCFMLLLSCNTDYFISERQARSRCFSNHVGAYKLDIVNSEIDENYRNDSAILSDLVIVFNPDSTFATNKRTLFLDDSFGRWDAGTCGFESAGKLEFSNTPHVIEFEPNRKDGSYMTIIGLNRANGKGANRFKFSKIYGMTK